MLHNIGYLTTYIVKQNYVTNMLSAKDQQKPVEKQMKGDQVRAVLAKDKLQ